MTFVHEPVLMEEVLAQARLASPRLIVDCTLGGAGHARALLEAFPEARLIGVDRDVEAVRAASLALAPFGDRAQIAHARFSEVPAVLHERGLAGCDFLLADLGVSSHQLDTGARGFSFRAQGPLDMRMDARDASAAEVLAGIDEEELARVIRTYGEERYARKVARAIVNDQPQTTEELAALVRRVVPRAKDGIDPATRTFQAIRILVNRELEELDALLASLPALLSPGGIACLISFHSLEDRAVKHAFSEARRGCTCPRSLPVCVCGKQPLLEVLTSKPVVASEAEVRRNVRARSAKLRAARRLAPLNGDPA